jgi:hypothetical protein
MGAVTTAAPAYTTGQTDPISLTLAGALRVDGSGVTQPVSGAVTANAGTGNFTVVQPTGTNLHVVLDSGTTVVTQPTAANLNATVVGTVTSNQGTPNTVANAWPIEVTNGTSVAFVTPASTAALAANPALVVALSPNSPLPAGANALGSVSVSNFPAFPAVQVVAGNLTNNNAAPAANNIGALTALAESTINAARYTTGDQVLPVVDLAGNTNVDVQFYLGAAVSKTNPIATTITDGTNVITAAISAYGTAPTGTEVMGVNAFITNIVPTIGTLTNNNAAPAATNFGVLPAIAEATVNPARYTSGDQVLLVTDLAGNINEDIQYVGGTAVVTGGVAGLLAVGGNVAAGTADSGNGVKTSGVYNTGVPVLTNGNRGDLQVDSRSYQIVTQAGTAATYTAAFTGLVPAATATDIMTITGSATKVVRVTKVVITATQTTQSVVETLLIKRSAANTGGTSTTATAVSHDSLDGAATATVRGYTANPTTLGAAVGTIVSRREWVGGAAPGGNLSPVENSFGVVMYEAGRPCKEIILRGAAQVLAVNLNAVTVAGGLYGMHIEWTEE